MHFFPFGTKVCLLPHCGDCFRTSGFLPYQSLFHKVFHQEQVLFQPCLSLAFLPWALIQSLCVSVMLIGPCCTLLHGEKNMHNANVNLLTIWCERTSRRKVVVRQKLTKDLRITIILPLFFKCENYYYCLM